MAGIECLYPLRKELISASRCIAVPVLLCLKTHSTGAVNVNEKKQKNAIKLLYGVLLASPGNKGRMHCLWVSEE